MFDPDATGIANGAYFGFEFDAASSGVSLLSVPWDVTVSYRDGCALAPTAIIEASTQVEIYDADFPTAWQSGIYTIPIDNRIASQSKKMRAQAHKVIAHIEAGGSEHDKQVEKPLRAVNEACEALHNDIYTICKAELDAGRRVGLIGGDHSTPLGLMRALGDKYTDFGVLHIDAHADLRVAYEGFEYSHASIMHNALKINNLSRLTQVAVRDYCKPEAAAAAADKRVTQFTDAQLNSNEFMGATWNQQCDQIIALLPANVHVSFDIDGLERAYCPTTGTPVPGGITYQKAIYLLTKLSAHRNIISFDVTEVAPSPVDEWDAIVGARLIYKLSLMLCQSKNSSNRP